MTNRKIFIVNLKSNDARGSSNASLQVMMKPPSSYALKHPRILHVSHPIFWIAPEQPSPSQTTSSAFDTPLFLFFSTVTWNSVTTRMIESRSSI